MNEHTPVLTGFLIPFVYLPDVALLIVSSPEQAVFLLSILGLVNTGGRVLCGWISDKPRVDPVKIYGYSFILGGLSTAVCTWFHHYVMLAAYAALFGWCAGMYVT